MYWGVGSIKKHFLKQGSFKLDIDRWEKGRASQTLGAAWAKVDYEREHRTLREFQIEQKIG